VAFSPDETTLAVGTAFYDGGGAGSVSLWDVRDPARPRQLGQPLVLNNDKPMTMDSVAFSPDGTTLAVGVGFSPGGGAGSVSLWDVRDPARPRQLGKPLFAGGAVAFSPQGPTLAVGGDIVNGVGAGSVSLWDVSDPARPRQLGRPLAVGDGNNVSSVAFDPGGSTLAVGGDVVNGVSAGSVSLWDVSDPARPRQLGQPLAAGDNVSSVALSPSGTTMAVGGSDGTQVWNRDVRYAINRICSQTAGELTPQQWRQYVPQLPYNPPCSSQR